MAQIADMATEVHFNTVRNVEEEVMQRVLDGETVRGAQNAARQGSAQVISGDAVARARAEQKARKENIGADSEGASAHSVRRYEERAARFVAANGALAVEVQHLYRGGMATPVSGDAVARARR